MCASSDAPANGADGCWKLVLYRLRTLHGAEAKTNAK